MQEKKDCLFLKDQRDKAVGAAESFTLACMQGGVLVRKPFISTGLKKKKPTDSMDWWHCKFTHTHRCGRLYYSLHILAMTVHSWSTAAVEVGDSQLLPDVYSLHHQPQTHGKSSPRHTKPKMLLGFYNLKQHILTDAPEMKIE